MLIRGSMTVLILYCTIYDFCERNFEGLWDLRELLLKLFLLCICFWVAIFSGFPEVRFKKREYFRLFNLIDLRQ